MIRIYQPTPLKIKSFIQLDGKAAHHLARVLRAKVGDPLIIFNGDGGEYEAVVSTITKKNVDVEILKFNDREAESALEIHLAQGIARGEKMDFIVQKAVELGVKKIIPLVTERTNVKINSAREEKKLAHWQGVVISACEQSGRNFVPEVVAPLALSDWLAQANIDIGFVLSPHVSNKLADRKIPAHAKIAILIGPEGGLSDGEIEAALSRGFLPLNLGPRVLRTETAPLAAITLLQSRFGDMS